MGAAAWKPCLPGNTKYLNYCSLMTDSSVLSQNGEGNRPRPTKPTAGIGSAVRLSARRLLSEIEPWSGCLASLCVPGYISDPATVSRGEGVYKADDWSIARQRDMPWDSDETYLQHIFGSEGMNVIAPISLARIFDFSRYRSIWEIGCGDMPQAYVIHRLYPRIRYVATDLDPWVIDRCSRLRVLEGIDKRVLDVLAISETEVPFAGSELLVSWGMEYALDDAQFLRLLGMARRHRVPYLMCSATTIGLGKYLRYLVQTPKRARLIKQRKIRLTGWERSLLHFYRLARRAQLHMEVLGRHGHHFCALFEPL